MTGCVSTELHQMNIKKICNQTGKVIIYIHKPENTLLK